jgi:hypothetical protein
MELPEPLTSLLSSIFMMLYGLFIEKWYVSRYSILSNIWSLFLAVFSLGNVDPSVRALFAVFCLVGVIGILKGAIPRPLTWVFGSRFVGGCLFALVFVNERWPLIWLELQHPALVLQPPITPPQQLSAALEWGFFTMLSGFFLVPVLPPISNGEGED